MATSESGLRTNLVYAAGYHVPISIPTSRLKDIGPTWGSWKTWSACDTDNVICHDLPKARELYQRAIHAVCNFYLPQKFYQNLTRPIGINFYQGDFLLETENLEDVVAMHLVSDLSDIVLLFGFDISQPGLIDDKLQRHKTANRLGLIRQVLIDHPNVQWILVDHDQTIDKAFEPISNLTCDTLENVLELLS